MIIHFSLWSSEINEDSLLTLKTRVNDVDKIIVHAEQEYDYTSDFEMASGLFFTFELLIEYSDKYNIPITIIISSTPNSTPLHNITDNRYRLVTIKHWWTYWLSATWRELGHVKPTAQPEIYKFPYTCLNGRPMQHRCILVDALYRFNIFNKGAITWNTTEFPFNASLYEYLQIPPITRLTEISKKQIVPLLDQFLLVKEYYQSFAQLIAETSPIIDSFVTEKTAVAIFNMKPFICLAEPGFHSQLQSVYGFEIYNELFDYSFDTVENLQERCDLLAKEMVKVCNMSSVEMTEMYQLLLPKLRRNRVKSKKLAMDITIVPNEPIDVYNTRKINNIEIGYGSPDLVKFILGE